MFDHPVDIVSELFGVFHEVGYIAPHLPLYLVGTVVHADPLGRAGVLAVEGKQGASVVGVDVSARHSDTLTHRIAAAAAADHAARYLPEPPSLLRRHGVAAHHLPRSFHHFAGYTSV